VCSDYFFFIIRPRPTVLAEVFIADIHPALRTFIAGIFRE
jgi:hypothetical protein